MATRVLIPRLSRLLNPTRPTFNALPIRKRHISPFPRLYTATSHSRLPSKSKPKLNPILLLAGSSILLWYISDYSPELKFLKTAFIRSFRAGATVISMATDYKLSLYNQSPEILGVEEYKRLKSEVHTRNATKLLNLAQTNGGIYVKLGQHLAALVYLLPEEYTDTMKPLQDRCPRTSMEDVRRLIREDLGCELEEIFGEFDEVPLGVASLAQVHRARFLVDAPTIDVGEDSENWRGKEVAVKIQHPYLDEFAPVDMRTCKVLVEWVKWAFPEFEFDWLAGEMELNLPKELDFVHEAANAERVRKNFENYPVLKIPDVYWAKRRLLVMEFIKGSRIDDLNYMQKHHINPRKVSTELARTYSQMIFQHGFVHCDPHPANVHIRTFSPKFSLWNPLRYIWPWRRNFEIILLDHGLYRELSDAFRLDYALLWTSLIHGDESDIEESCRKVFSHNPILLASSSSSSSSSSQKELPSHRMFACVLTGRSWDTITSKTGLVTERTQTELDAIQTKASEGDFMIDLTHFLAQVPRELLLLLKTNDLLRSVDESLLVTKSGDVKGHLMKTIGIQGWYCAKAIKDETLFKLLPGNRKLNFVNWVLLMGEPKFWKCYRRFWKTGVELWMLDLYLVARRVLAVS